MTDFFQTNEQYNEGIIISRYSGQFSLNVARRTDEGTYSKWVHPSQGKGKEPNPKVIPMGTPLMDRSKLIDMANWILDELGQAPPSDGYKSSDDDIPF